MSLPNLSPVLVAKPFKGKLSPQQASEAIDAARRTADDLLKTAEVLFEHDRFAHCVTMSILAIEEAGKQPIIMGILLGWIELSSGWKDYIRHAAKTRFINGAIVMQERNYFPQLPRQFAEAIGKTGPDPDILEKTKQRSLYSDCLDKKGKFQIHEPSAIDWKDIAHYVLCDARVVVAALRHYSAAELSVWLKHSKLCQKDRRGFETGLTALEKELREAGFIQPGWWKNILESAAPSG